MLKKCMSMVLVIALLISFSFVLPLSAFAVDVDDVSLGVGNSEFAGGDGTEDSPYLISTPEHLNNVRNYLGAYFRQISDIDMASITNWKPIGNAGSNTGSTLIHELPSVTYEPFEGYYDGNNYKILNLTINDNKISFVNDVYGLFAALGKCTVKNVHLVGNDFSIDKSSTDYVNLWKEYGASYGVYVGGIAGKCTGDSIVTNCSCSGTISVINCSDANVGGILGYGKASHCRNSTDIFVNANKSSRYEKDSTVHCGGIVGSTTSVNGVVSECLNQGKIKATAGNFLYVGGISGEYGRIENCMNCGNIEGHTITNSSYSGFAGNCNLGGIVGATSSDYTRYCVNYGSISSSVDNYKWSSSSYAGGIAGYCGYYGSGKIISCVNIAESISSSKKDKDNNTIDASAGRIAGMSISTSDCYSINSTIVNGSSTNGNSSDNNGENMSNSDLLSQRPYVNFDFEKYWSIDEKLGGAVLTGYYVEFGEEPNNKRDIDISRDTWSFKNFNGCGKKYWEFWYPSLQADELSKYVKAADGGVCFGMVMSAMTLNSNDQNATDFNRSTVSDISKTDISNTLNISATDYIRYMYPLQISSLLSEGYRHDLSGLYQAVKDYENGKNDGVEIGVYGRYFFDDHAGHSLWGIKAIDEDACSKIQVYDCNHPNETRYIILDKDNDGNYTSWSYDPGIFGAAKFGTNQKGNPEIKYIDFDGTFYPIICNKLLGINSTFSPGYTDKALAAITEGEIDSSQNPKSLDFVGISEMSEEEAYAYQMAGKKKLYWVDSKNPISFYNNDEGISAQIIGDYSSVEVQSEGNNAEIYINERSVDVSNLDKQDNLSVQYKSLDGDNDAITLSFNVTTAVDGASISFDNELNTTLRGVEEINFSLSEYEHDKQYELLNYYNKIHAVKVDPDKEYTVIVDTNDTTNSVTVKEKDVDNELSQTIISYDYSNILGDADGDGSVSIIDVTMIQRKLADFTVNNPENVDILGDVTRDELDIVDATCIQRYLAEFENIYKIGSKID